MESTRDGIIGGDSTIFDKVWDASKGLQPPYIRGEKKDSDGNPVNFGAHMEKTFGPTIDSIVTAEQADLEEFLRATSSETAKLPDMVNHPPHYQSANGTMEVIQVIEAFELNYNLGSVVKYLLRAGKKGGRTEDLEKAAWFLNRELEGRT